MTWDEFYHYFQHKGDNDINFNFSSVLSKPKDFYKILEVDYDATEEVIRSNYIRLALKWHPDKKKDEDSATSRFQDINEAYQEFFYVNRDGPCYIYDDFKILSDPVKRREYDKKGMLYAYDNNVIDYLYRYKGLILTCNGLGMKCSIW